MKETVILFQKALLSLQDTNSAGSLDAINKHIDTLLEGDYSLLCVNRIENKKRHMPFKALHNNNKRFWQQKSNWVFYISEEDFKEIKEKTAGKAVFRAKKLDINMAKIDSDDIDSDYGPDFGRISSLSNAEQLRLMNNDKIKLDDLINQKSPDNEVVTEALIDSTKDAALINQSVMQNSMNINDSEAKRLTQNLVDSTFDMVKSSAQLVSANVMNDEMMHNLMEKSNGTIINHITKTYLNGISFLTYYNNLVSSSNMTINRLRIVFANKYRHIYSLLLPHVSPDDITLERVFYKGMMTIPPELLIRWALGFLIHDIGKAAAVEYHEGENAYNRDIVTDHVKHGYDYIMKKTNFPKEAGIIAGYHHEYYGHESGYGYFRSYQEQYKKKFPDAKHDYCIAYELKPLLEYKTHAYFPAKVLEIIDIYDSITDPKRKYRAALSHDEAIAMMKREFIDKTPKIDPIIYDLFISFMREKQKNTKK